MAERSKAADLRSAGQMSAWVRTPLQARDFLFWSFQLDGVYDLKFILNSKLICAISFSGNRQSAAIAQLGERQTEDLKVPGSIPGGGILSFWLKLVYILHLTLTFFLSG